MVVKCVLLVTMMETVMLEIKSDVAASEANKESDDPKVRKRRKSRPRNTMTIRYLVHHIFIELKRPSQ